MAYTSIARTGYDIARRQLKMPDTLVFYRKATSGPNKGGLESYYTLTGGWLLYWAKEVVEGQTIRYQALVFTNDRADLTQAVMQDLTHILYRGMLYKKRDMRPTISYDPDLWQGGFEAQGVQPS